MSDLHDLGFLDCVCGFGERVREFLVRTQTNLRAIRDHIVCAAAREFHDVLMDRRGEGVLKNAVFSVNARKIRVGCKAGMRRGERLEIGFDAQRSGLLVCAGDEAHGAFEFDAGIFDRFQRIERRDHGPLVVERSSAVHLAVVNLGSVRRVNPIGGIALGDHVHMSDDADIVLALALEFHVSADILVIVGCKAQRFRLSQNAHEGFVRTFAERMRSVVFFFYALDTDKFL